MGKKILGFKTNACDTYQKIKEALYNARQILMSNSYGVDNAISKVPQYLKKDPGLEYDRLRWRNRRGRLESSLKFLSKFK